MASSQGENFRGPGSQRRLVSGTAGRQCDSTPSAACGAGQPSRQAARGSRTRPLRSSQVTQGARQGQSGRLSHPETCRCGRPTHQAGRSNLPDAQSGRLQQTQGCAEAGWVGATSKPPEAGQGAGLPARVQSPWAGQPRAAQPAEQRCGRTTAQRDQSESWSVRHRGPQSVSYSPSSTDGVWAARRSRWTPSDTPCQARVPSARYGRAVSQSAVVRQTDHTLLGPQAPMKSGFRQTQPDRRISRQ